MKQVIYKCDICGAETDLDLMLHTETEKDVCAGCLEKLVNEYFEKRDAKFEEVLASASAKAPLPSKKKDKEPEDPKEPERKPECRIDYGAAQALRDAGWTVEKIAKELGCSKASIFNNTHPADPKKAKLNEWNEDDIKRLG